MSGRRVLSEAYSLRVNFRADGLDVHDVLDRFVYVHVVGDEQPLQRLGLGAPQR